MQLGIYATDLRLITPNDKYGVNTMKKSQIVKRLKSIG